MRTAFVIAAAAAAFGTAGAGQAAVSGPHGFCQVRFVDGGPLYSGTGTTVQTPSGERLSVCRVRVAPPAETVVTSFPGSGGSVVVVTRSGAAIVVFHTS